ncbi:hypothetical protein [Actinomycetospora soli]|uniref:hypothetical protein n=1 Tax=Actinomycetospora soli TaxID=2893887 RepID=UPI001E4D5EB5|nr:hypothetical protein [Actinomycetospora soli]MCD2191657.1 hypothetical protein [Actinomycetospora soli]
MPPAKRRGAGSAEALSRWTTTSAPTVEPVPAPTPAEPAAPTSTPAPAPAPASPAQRRSVAFTARLDPETDARFGRLLEEARTVVGPIATRADRGRVRSGYDVSRADLLRALLAVLEDDAAVGNAVHDHLRKHYGATTP